MIIEDDLISVKLLRLLTENLGFEVSVAENGIEALEQTKKTNP